MIRRIREKWNRDMIRPLIYKIFTRGILALFAAELAHTFLPGSWPLSMFSNLFLVLGLLFLAGVLLARLRLDGLKIPQLKLPRMKRKDPAYMAGDIADHIDDDIKGFDDLDKEEQDVCVLLADALLAAVCLLLAAVL